MRRNLILTLALALSAPSLPTVAHEAATLSPDAAAAHEDAALVAKGSVESLRKELSIGCTTAPLPTTPDGQSWSAEVNDSFVGVQTRFRFTAWRKRCSDTDSQLMVTLTPTAGPVAIATPFAVRQNNRGYNVSLVQDATGRGFNGQLTQPTTVLLRYDGSQSSAFDDDAALTIQVLTFGTDTVALNVPAKDTGTTPTPTFVIDGRVRGPYYNQPTSGQGLFLEVIEGSSPLLAAGWYTASPDPTKAEQHEWFTLIGPITGNVATLEIQSSVGQRFMQPTTVTTTTVGTAKITFTNCTSGTFEWSFPAFNKSGSVPIVRLTPAPAGCP